MPVTAITAYIDVKSPELRQRIEQIASASGVSDGNVIDCHGDFVHTWFTNPVHACGDHEFVCFISEAQTFHDADVVFAVFHCRMPVLLLGCPGGCAMESPLVMRSDSTSTMEAKLSLLSSFFPSETTSKQVIVLEGGDGAGKATQTALLVEHLRRDGRRVHTLDFPYEPGLYGSLVRVILSGKKGGISELDPRLFSFLYSMNRYGCLPELRLWTQHGCSVVLDRYYTANFGHQASKLPVEGRKAFIHHLEEMEVDWLGLPRARNVFYLDLPPQVALEAMKNDTTRQYLDIHETASGNYKENVRLSYLWCCKELAGWHHVLCCDLNEGQRLPREAVHDVIYSTLEGGACVCRD